MHPMCEVGPGRLLWVSGACPLPVAVRCGQGPWGPGAPGVCEEQVQSEGKAGQDSPSFWKKGDPAQ